MMNNLRTELKKTEKSVIDGIKAAQERYQDALKLTLEDLETLNNKKPIISESGWHAPYDGYIGLNGGVYLAGQFIPGSKFSEPMDQFDEGTVSIKIKTKDEKELQDLILGLEGINLVYFNKSKTWNQNGEEYAFYRITGNLPYMRTIGSVFQSFNKKEMKKKEELKGTAPRGKQEIEGVILSIREHMTDFGVSIRMMVELDNKSTVWGTLPKSLHFAEVGDRVSFVATFTHADGGKHAFFKRPSKARVL